MEAVSINQDVAAQLLMTMGQCTEAVLGLRRDMDSVWRDFKEHDRRDSETRKALYAKFEELDKRMIAVESNSNAMKKVVTEDIVPTIEKLKTLEQRGVGAVAAIGVFVTLVGTSLFNYVYNHWDGITKLFKGI